MTHRDLIGVLDVVIVGVVFYAFLVALKRTRRSGLALAGILTMGAIYLAARGLDLRLTVALLQGFFAALLFALVVIFQEDLRYFFERVGLWWIERRNPLRRVRQNRLPRSEVEILVRTLMDLARARIGALVVIQGRDPILRHLTGGVLVEGRLSEALLKSIFDPHSIGHDGAVIVRGDRVDRLGCQLPLSKHLEKLQRSGTRHAAALGLSELNDAFCLVVSEERGTVSVARRGEIRTVEGSGAFMDVLEDFYTEMAPRETPGWTDLLRRNGREKVMALVLSVLFWFIIVRQSEEMEKTFDVPVAYAVPGNLEVLSVDSKLVKVRFRAPRSKFRFLEPNDIRIQLDLLSGYPGTQTRSISTRDVSYPTALDLVDIEPHELRFVLTNRPTAAPAP